jgi:hypothetical protein
MNRGTRAPDTNTSPMVAGAAAHEAPAMEAASRQEPAAGAARGASPVRSIPATRPSYDPVRRQPHRGDWPHRLPPTPRFNATRSEAAPAAEDALSER